MDIKSKFDTNNEYKTEKQWKKQNRIVNQGEVGRRMWCNGFCHQIAEYFSIEQTHPATTEELKVLKNNRRLIQKRYSDNAKVRREGIIREQVSREWECKLNAEVVALYTVIGALFITAAICICEYKIFKKNIRFYVSLLLCMTSIFMPLLGLGKMYREIRNEQKTEIEEIKENADNIVFFIDGNQVEYGTFDLEQYDYSYDTENNKVYMTSK